jgi:hypothetical protein
MPHYEYFSPRLQDIVLENFDSGGILGGLCSMPTLRQRSSGEACVSFLPGLIKRDSVMEQK